MNVRLLYRTQDLDFQPELPPWQRPRDIPPPPGPSPTELAMMQDLELNVLFNAMACGDDFLLQVARRVILLGPQEDQETVLYRQAVLKDCLRNDLVVRALYNIAVEAIESKQRGWFSILGHSPAGILSDGVRYLSMLTGMLDKLRRMADEQAGKFESAGFRAFFASAAHFLAATRKWWAGIRACGLARPLPRVP